MFRILLIALVLAMPSSLFAAEAKKDNSADKYFPIRTLLDRCVDFSQIKYGEDSIDYGDCRVSESGEIGKINNHTYYYALYCVIPSHSIKEGTCDSQTFNARYFKKRGLAIFVQEGANEKARLLNSYVCPDIGLYVYDKPDIIKNAFGVILYVPIALDGTGHGNDSEYYIWEDRRWHKIDSVNWLEDLRKRLPSDVELWKGIWPNVQDMTAKAPLYQKGDANCCPSGGTAEITLSVENKQFIIKSMEIRSELMMKGHKQQKTN